MEHDARGVMLLAVAGLLSIAILVGAFFAAARVAGRSGSFVGVLAFLLFAFLPPLIIVYLLLPEPPSGSRGAGGRDRQTADLARLREAQDRELEEWEHRKKPERATQDLDHDIDAALGLDESDG